MEAPQHTEIAPPTPEQLLALLALQAERDRSKRAKRSRNRAIFLATSVLAIVTAMAIALFVAMQMATEVREHAQLDSRAAAIPVER